jgi:release factor glutamine methyltransferase
MDAAMDTSTRDATVGALLTAGSAALAGAGVGTPRLDAELLLAAACGLDRTALYARGREPLAEACAATFRALVTRRMRREPLQYIVGRQEFWSLDFTVTRDVLIPRPETELLVELAVSLLSPPFEKGGPGGICGAADGHAAAPIPLNPPFPKGEIGARPLLCDVGTGSGCIAVALARELSSAEVWALDVSPDALAIAAANARQHGVAERIRFLRSDLFAAAARQRFDVIVSNPPYLTTADLAALQPEVAAEPRAALDGGADGLDIIRRLLTAAPDHLAAGGWLLMEIGAAQSAVVEDAAQAAGLSAVTIRPDWAGLPRVLMARC